MKKNLQHSLLTFLILLSIPFSIRAQQIKIVEINATALIEDKNTDNYSIVIYSDGVLKDSIFNK